MKRILLLIAFLLIGAKFYAQTFTSSTSELNGSYHSGGVVGVVDMDNNGYDDIVIMDESNYLYIEYQNSDGTFTVSDIGSVSGNGQWGMAVGDIDNDGHKDVISGGSYDGFHIANIDNPTTHSITTLNSTLFMQGLSFGDINNDGWIDALGCHDDAESLIWANDGAGNLAENESWVDMETTPVSDNSGNYGSVFCDIDDDGDLDIYIAKCRQGVSNSNDPRRINVLYINDGNNNFTEEAAIRGLAPHKQSWTSDFMDIDNDGDFDCFLTNHDFSLMLFENDGTGYFTDITSTSGFSGYEGFFLQGKFEDFDNDGFVDLLYSGGSGSSGLMRNNGDNSFSPVSHNFNDDDDLHSFGIGDLNHDGWQDFYASYGNGYITPDDTQEDVIWFNDGGSNNWINFQLEGTMSNESAIGAKVKIYGDWGVQVREVRGGESYGITNTFILHFGLGAATSIDYAIIEWPEGGATFIDNPDINQFFYSLEGSCPELSISIDGSTGNVLCPGESAVLTAATTTSTVLWSSGEETNSITIVEPGNYSAITYDENGCAAVSETVVVNFYESIDPIISASGSLQFCAGDNVDLMVDNPQEGSSYTWSNSDTGETSEVSTSGIYSVSVLDACDNTFNSTSLTVDVMEAPTLDIDDQAFTVGETVTFNSNTANTYWFATENSETPLYEGMNFTTPILSESTSYWAQASTDNLSEEFVGGKNEIGESGHYHQNSDYWMYFDAYSDLTISTFKVYAGSDGSRNIIIEDNMGVTVYSEDIYIYEGESVITINAIIPEGNDYAIRTSGNPDLWRDQSDANLPYPYEVGDALAITGTNISSNNWDNYYYFFYDWHVVVGAEVCYGPLVEIHATTDISISEHSFNDNYSIYPNPFNESINIIQKATGENELEIGIYNALGALVVKEKVVLKSNENFTMDLSTLESGLYTISVLNNSKLSSSKLIKK